MINRIVFIGFFAMLLVKTGTAQNIDSVTSSTFPVNLFNPEDTMGITVFSLLDNFEKYGHFGAIEEKRKDGNFINKFAALFDSTATVPDDLSDTIIQDKNVSIAEYKQLANQKGYQEYSLFIEKVDFVRAYKIDDSGNFYITLKMLKLYSGKAFIGEKYAHAAMFTLGLRFRVDTAVAYITDIKMMEGSEYQNFLLGKYGRHIYSSILVTNNLEQLIQPVPPPYVPQSTPTKSNLFFHGGYQFLDHLGPENYTNNVGPFYSSSGTQQGYSFGFNFQKAFSPKDIFGISLGIEYEENSYGFNQADASFVYTDSPDGSGLRDKEGGKYDERIVDLTSYVEDGKISYIKPEIGLFFNIGNGPIRFQFIASIGNAFLFSNEYSAKSLTSYRGQIYGLGASITGDQLGFYTDKETNFGGDLTEIQSFFFYKGGLSIDFVLSDRVALSILGEYKSSFTYVIRENENNYPFFDADTEEGFDSQLNQLDFSRLYKGFGLQAGIKIFLNEKR